MLVRDGATAETLGAITIGVPTGADSELSDYQVLCPPDFFLKILRKVPTVHGNF